MPSAVLKSLAAKAGKSEAEAEKLWKEAKAAAHKQYPDLSEEDDKFWAIVTSIVKKMLGIKESSDADVEHMLTEAAAFINKLVDLSGKSEPEVEKIWYAARKDVEKENPDLSPDDEDNKFWDLVLMKAKEMLGVNESKTFTDLLDGEMALLEAVDVQPEHPGILAVPEGKDVMELPLSHFVSLAKDKGLAAISKALVNLARWNKEKNPKLSNWADAMQAKLSKEFESK